MIILLSLISCQEDKIGFSFQTSPTVDWVTSTPFDSGIPIDSGLDTAQMRAEKIQPFNTALGFGSAMWCETDQCWITAPFGPEAQLYHLETDLTLIQSYPFGVGNQLSLASNSILLNGPDGIYNADGLLAPIGHTGSISCIDALQCAVTQAEGMITTELYPEDHPKAIVNDGAFWYWQNKNGHLQNNQGLESAWQGSEIHSLQITENTIWAGSPKEGCIHQFNKSNLEQVDSWCSALLGFGYSLLPISQNSILVGAPSAFGGKGYLGFWEEGREVWAQSDLIPGTGFGSQVQVLKDRILISAPNANMGTGLVYIVEWP